MEIQKAKINLVGVWALNLAFAKFRLFAAPWGYDLHPNAKVFKKLKI